MKRKIQRRQTKTMAPKKCFFCTEGKEPQFWDITSLFKCTTDRGKILGRQRTGLCAKHQRRATTAIKHARHLALMPFIQRV